MNFRKSIGRKIIHIYKSRKRKTFNATNDHCLNTVRSMLKKSKYCFLITNSNREWPSARMVQPIIDFDTLSLWFGTNPSLRKVKEIEENQNVTIAFGSERENANLIIYGKAHIVRDIQKKKNHWVGSWLLFFPGGPKSDDFISIKVDPLEIELMNFRRSIVPEPFGLKPVKMIKTNGNWKVQED